MESLDHVHRDPSVICYLTTVREILLSILYSLNAGVRHCDVICRQSSQILLNKGNVFIINIGFSC